MIKKINYFFQAILISFCFNSEIFCEKILIFLTMIFFDLNKGPKKENKTEKTFLLIVIPKIRPIKKNR